MTAPLSFQGKDRLKFWDLTAATALYLQGGDLAGTGGFPQPWEAFSGLAWNKLHNFSLGLLQELEMSQVMAEMPLCCVALPGFPCCPLWPTLPG